MRSLFSEKLKVAVFTATRAEYGLLRWVMEELQSDDRFALQIIVTGQHLSVEHGRTVAEIERDGFSISALIEASLDGDDHLSVANAMAQVTAGMAESLVNLSSDMVILLGDRYELLAAASAALVGGVPIAHIHGGELTEGAFDDAIRHAITKLSTRHFVTSESAYRRVIQLGENPSTVVKVGGLGVDAISRIKQMDDVELEAFLGYRLAKHIFLVTFHPVTLGKVSDVQQIENLLAALRQVAAELDDTSVVMTAPNADPGRRQIASMITAFCDNNDWAHFHPSLGQRAYFSLLSRATAVVGNSSSGILEAPSFRVPTVNIGTRQWGRECAASVISCEPVQSEIEKALRYTISDEMKDLCSTVISPFGTGGAAKKIVEDLVNFFPEKNSAKSFFDVEYSYREAAEGDL